MEFLEDEFLQLSRDDAAILVEYDVAVERAVLDVAAFTLGLPVNAF